MIMGMWEILEEGRDDYGRGFGMRGDEVEEAYKEGCRHGYEKAMREIHGDEVQDNVHFLGFQNNPMKMVADSKVMILTSRWEGTPMCALEAMALGTPVVSTPSDGMKDLIENGVDGYLSDEDAVLAEDILKIVEDPDHRRLLSENAAKKFAKINDEEKYNDTILACYRQWGGAL